MSNLTTFNFQSVQVSVIIIDSDPWFVASEICTVLEIEVNDALKRLDEDEKMSTDSICTTLLGDIKSKWLISESGLYSLVLGSRKPQAKPFKRWVTSEVLPQIRKTGSYSIQQLSPLEMMRLQLDKMIELEKAQKETEQKLLTQSSQLTTLTVEVKTVNDQLSAIKEFVSITEPPLEQTIPQKINFVFQKLGGALHRAGAYDSVGKACSALWSELGLTMRNSDSRYDLNARLKNAQRTSTSKLTRTDILRRDNMLVQGFRSAQQVVLNHLGKLNS